MKRCGLAATPVRARAASAGKGSDPLTAMDSRAPDPEARIYVIATAVRDWYAFRGVRASVRRAHASPSRYV